MNLRLDDAVARPEKPALSVSFNILGFTLASIELDIVRPPEEPATKPVTVLDRGIKAMSGFWVKRMMSG